MSKSHSSLTHIEPLDRSIYEYMKAKAASFEVERSPLLDSYIKTSERYYSRPFEISSFAEIKRQIKKSKITYIGDFHTFSQSGKNVERLLRSFHGEKTELTIAVEFLQISHQNLIDAYLQDELTEIAFLKAINFKESWRFDWKQYKQIFKVAKESGHGIIGINSQGNLEERDQAAARSIVSYAKKNPDRKIIAFIGELHILPSKLPLRTLLLSRGQLTYTILYQNLDQVYWAGYPKTRESSIYKFTDNEFVLQTSPPWVKYESMIHWYENLIDDPEFDFTESAIESGIKVLSSSASEYFLNILTSIKKTLKVKICSEELEDFSLYDYSKIEFVNKKILSLKHPELEQLFTLLLLKGKSFKLPSKRAYYCSNYSMTRLSFLAGAHLFDVLFPESEELLFHGDHPIQFLYFFYQHLTSYTASKIINPNRKCALYHDLKSRSSDGEPNTEKKEVAILALQILESKKSLSKLNDHSIKVVFSTAKALAYLTAELLYENQKLTSKDLQTFPISLEEGEKYLFKLFNSVGFKNRKKKLF